MNTKPFFFSLPYQAAFIGPRAQRLANLIGEQGESFFRSAGSVTPVRCVSSLLFINSNGPASIVEIARSLGEQHQLTAHRMAQLEKLSLVRRKADASDRRRKTYHLTAKGKIETALIEERCHRAAEIFNTLSQEIGFDLPAVLDAAFDALSKKSLDERSP
ncbi:MAG: winged helix DNA-binding protein [Lysobacterales bacterium]